MEPEQDNGWPDTELVVARFRRWLDETRTEAELNGDELDADPVEHVGLYQLVEGLTALRHEVKLLTKGIRSTDERSEATLVSMQAAIEQFRSVQAQESEVADRALRPLVEGLADLDQALRRGRRAIETARRQWSERESDRLIETRQRFEQLYRCQAWWRRAICRPWHQALLDIHGQRTLDPQRNIFDALLEGYDLILARLQRTMDEHGLLRMECVGHQVDPQRMTVVETVIDLGRPPGCVVEEIRTGYYWNSRLLRYAEVKVVGER
jgi:molecular chaperone GrpE (heat shock protein)